MNHPNEITPHLFRTEYSKIVAVLCRTFHLRHIEIAEDIASDTFLKAAENWSLHGLPENPAAWLYTVARNKAKDYFKHLKVFETHVKQAIKPIETEAEPAFEFDYPIISDSQLAMIFAVCDPGNSMEGQICLALQILCGFSVEEIANAFLARPETIKKRLHRARTRLRNDNFQLTTLSETVIKERLGTVLKTLYLLFNEGYYSKTTDQLIRKDLCSEAIRLTLVLTGKDLTNTPETNALLALLFFQSSRLNARVDVKGEAVLLDQQDKSLWDQSLIAKGNEYLISACTGNELSPYHLEAAIAYWHTTPTDQRKWEHILELYNQLILIEYSPVTALNRSFAYAKVHGQEKGIVEAEKLGLEENSHYHGLLGYLYAGIDMGKAVLHYEQAVKLTRSKAERQKLRQAVERLRRS